MGTHTRTDRDAERVTAARLVDRGRRSRARHPETPDRFVLPVAVAEVLALGAEAETQSDGAFSIRLPSSDGSVNLDRTGVVKGWAVQRAARHLAALAGTELLPVRRR